MLLGLMWLGISTGGSNNTVGIGTTTTLTVQYPSTTTLANTWGTVTLTGSQTGG
jgi:hypothetical protein